MKIIKNFLIPILAIILFIIGCIKVNIVNTKSLSPIGNAEDNFKVVSKEFGQDFEEFIKDNSPIKIYLGEENDGLAMVKLYDKEINLTNDNLFMDSIKGIEGYIENTFNNLKDKINKNTKTNNESEGNYKLINKEINSDFDKNVDEFIKNISK